MVLIGLQLSRCIVALRRFYIIRNLNTKVVFSGMKEYVSIFPTKDPMASVA